MLRHADSPHIDTDTLLDIIEHQRIGAEFQPIKHTGTLATIGHEALARFYKRTGQPIPPQAVFATLHGSPVTLVQAELMSKRWQIDSAPQDGLLFLNLDPDAFTTSGVNPDQHPMLQLLGQPDRIVVEIIENASIQDADRSLWLAECLAARGILTALDDIGGVGTMLSLPILCNVDIFKFDRHWLQAIHQPAQRRMLKMLLNYAREENKKTVLEGIETVDDLAIARELQVDYVQGYLFRPEFINKQA